MSEKTMSLLDVQSGDLLAWTKNPYSKISDIVIHLIGWLTHSPYGHVGIAWRCHDGIGDELFVVESTFPRIQLSRATEDRFFYCIPMDLEWSGKSKRFLMEKIGLPYGTMDAIRAFLGIHTEDDDHWQCAELAQRFYQESGILLPEEFRPKDVVKNAVDFTGRDVFRVLTS